ncbi:MAG: septum formation protein Maf [Chitinophagaceae bacterium]|nr:septum formation protein Maf [Chitinophagaceae bacterium]
MDSLPWILGSKSPRRHQLMTMANIPFEIKTKDTEEIYPDDMLAEDVPAFLAELKARDIALDFPERTILSADTIVLLEGRILGKPQHRDEAFSMLNDLQGKTHHVITGVCLWQPDHIHSFSDITKVRFHTLSDSEINYYLDHYKPYDKAGSYAIQEWIGAVAIASIEGCFYNVMGLPISRIYSLYTKK